MEVEERAISTDLFEGVLHGQRSRFASSLLLLFSRR